MTSLDKSAKVSHDTLSCRQYLINIVDRPGLAHFPGITYEAPVFSDTRLTGGREFETDNVIPTMDRQLGSNSNQVVSCVCTLRLVPLASRGDDPRTILHAMALPGITAFLAETVDQGLSLSPLHALKGSLLLCSL